MDTKRPRGRPERPGDWVKLTVRLPRDWAEWLRAQPEPQGDVIVKGLEALQKQEKRRR